MAFEYRVLLGFTHPNSIYDPPKLSSDDLTEEELVALFPGGVNARDIGDDVEVHLVHWHGDPSLGAAIIAVTVGNTKTAGRTSVRESMRGLAIARVWNDATHTHLATYGEDGANLAAQQTGRETHPLTSDGVVRVCLLMASVVVFQFCLSYCDCSISQLLI